MADKKDGTYDRLIKVGLQDPFIRGVAGMVVIAAAASYAISALGSGTKAVITLALCLAFGVVLVVMRTLMNYADGAFVKVVCFASSAVIMSVFLVFAVLLVPAAVMCWPQPYAQLLSLPHCASAPKPFSPIEYTGKGITYNPDNKRYHVLVFYRPERQEDAERIVGALRLAGYNSDDGIQSDLKEVFAPDRRPGVTLVKTTTFARPVVDEVSSVVRSAIPVKAPSVSLFGDDAPLHKGHVQVSLF